jgi:hypothetical protein
MSQITYAKLGIKPKLDEVINLYVNDNNTK